MLLRPEQYWACSVLDFKTISSQWNKPHSQSLGLSFLLTRFFPSPHVSHFLVLFSRGRSPSDDCMWEEQTWAGQNFYCKMAPKSKKRRVPELHNNHNAFSSMLFLWICGMCPQLLLERGADVNEVSSQVKKKALSLLKLSYFFWLFESGPNSFNDGDLCPDSSNPWDASLFVEKMAPRFTKTEPRVSTVSLIYSISSPLN